MALGGYVYHVLNRANGRLRIFRKAGDFLGFEKSVAETDVSSIRNSMKRGAPLGLGPWVLETARRMALESTLRPKGRPRKSTGPLYFSQCTD